MANPRKLFRETPFRRAKTFNPHMLLRGVGDAWETEMTNVNDSSSVYGGDVVLDSEGNAYQLDEDGTIIAYTTQDGSTVINNTVAPDMDSPAAPSGMNPQQWAELLSKTIPQVIAGINAYQLSQVNIDRARRGLPALSANQYGPRVGVGLSGDTQKLVMFAALGLGAFMLLKRR